MKSDFIDMRRYSNNTLGMTLENKQIVERALAALICTRDVAAVAPFCATTSCITDPIRPHPTRWNGSPP